MKNALIYSVLLVPLATMHINHYSLHLVER